MALVVAGQLVPVDFEAEDISLDPLARTRQLHSFPALGLGATLTRMASQVTPGNECKLIQQSQTNSISYIVSLLLGVLTTQIEADKTNKLITKFSTVVGCNSRCSYNRF